MGPPLVVLWPAFPPIAIDKGIVINWGWAEEDAAKYYIIDKDITVVDF